jgi:hypothetical protein
VSRNVSIFPALQLSIMRTETRDRLDKKETVMKKRLISILVLAVVVLATAPVAMADHCQICNSNLLCRPASSGGKLNCVSTPTSCTLSGACGGPHPLIDVEDFAAEYTVASVERLDEPKSPASETETRVASLETPQPANR